MGTRNVIAIVHEGDRIPFDGTVVDGFAQVDESAETGVSAPAMLEAAAGRNNAIAGTLIVSGWLKIESTMKQVQPAPQQVDGVLVFVAAMFFATFAGLLGFAATHSAKAAACLAVFGFALGVYEMCCGRRD